MGKVAEASSDAATGSDIVAASSDLATIRSINHCCREDSERQRRWRSVPRQQKKSTVCVFDVWLVLEGGSHVCLSFFGVTEPHVTASLKAYP